ncbi:MAG: dockerin type I repeat-containing protein, partial [Ruminococcus sp.]|nr:dockerin type I repeat-containing protein [Ruminococcus sp.]
EIPTEPTEPTEPQPGYQLGDVNKDGVVDIKDATYLSLALAQKSGYTVTLELGDVNKDGYLNARDVTALQRYVADKS